MLVIFCPLFCWIVVLLLIWRFLQVSPAGTLLVICDASIFSQLMTGFLVFFFFYFYFLMDCSLTLLKVSFHPSHFNSVFQVGFLIGHINEVAFDILLINQFLLTKFFSPRVWKSWMSLKWIFGLKDQKCTQRCLKQKQKWSASLSVKSSEFFNQERTACDWTPSLDDMRLTVCPVSRNFTLSLSAPASEYQDCFCVIEWQQSWES